MCFDGLYTSVYFNHHPLASEQVEDGPKDTSDEGTREDNDVVRHTKVGCREIHEERTGINTPFARGGDIFCVSAASSGGVPAGLSNGNRREHRARQIPPALCVRRVLCVPQEGLADVHSDVHRLSRREVQEGLQRRGSAMRNGRDICQLDEEIIWRVTYP